jgi:hypothetical protein
MAAEISLSPLLFGTGNHAGYKKTDDDRMTFSYERLPDEVRALIDGTRQLTPV